MPREVSRRSTGHQTERRPGQVKGAVWWVDEPAESVRVRAFGPRQNGPADLGTSEGKKRPGPRETVKGPRGTNEETRALSTRVGKTVGSNVPGTVKGPRGNCLKGDRGACQDWALHRGPDPGLGHDRRPRARYRDPGAPNRLEKRK